MPKLSCVAVYLIRSEVKNIDRFLWKNFGAHVVEVEN